ncbi:MAG: DUF2165 family protein [Pseudomonadota bacterium]
MLLLAETVMTGLIGVWMVTGAVDNWRFPELNRAAVETVLRMDRMAEQYPDDFAHVAHRRVTHDGLIRIGFRIIVIWESLAALLLCIGTALLGFATLTGTDPGLARDVALAGALTFTVNWAGFLIGGNYFCYYYCHFEGQFTHFMLVIWGAVVVAFLALAQQIPV